jgi:hypothetical protein
MTCIYITTVVAGHTLQHLLFYFIIIYIYIYIYINKANFYVLYVVGRTDGHISYTTT